MKNLKQIITGIVLAILLSTGSLLAQFDGGSGLENDPWQIRTAAQLNNVRTYLGDDSYNKYYQLTDNIDLTVYLASGGAGYAAWGSAGWMPIGDNVNKFKGKFNGNGKIISGLNINRPTADFVGLFGFIGNNGEVKNLGVEISGSVIGHNVVGGIVGESDNIVKSCFVTGIVSGENLVGGLMGLNYGWLTNCYSRATVAGLNNIGGLLGYNCTGYTVYYCYSTGLVTVPSGGNRGALIGYNLYQTVNTVNYCYFDLQTSNDQYTSLWGAGKTTIQMKTQSTFEGWDFINETANGTNDYWSINPAINDGYPYLFVNLPLSIESLREPTGSQLLSNYPNPFNPSTVISYNLNNSGLIKLSVYNTKGEMIKTLVNSVQSAGRYSVNFDGAGFNSGVYFYKLETDGKSIIKQMIMCK